MADEPTPDAESPQPEEQDLSAEHAAKDAAAEQPAAAAEAPAEAEAESAPAAEAEPAPSEQAAAPADAPEAETENSAEEDEEEEEPTPRVKPEVPGLHLEVDIVPEGVDPLGRGEAADPYAIDPYAVDEEQEPQTATEEQEEPVQQPISAVAIDLASGARYKATGKRKTAIARVILRPGTGEYLVNGRSLEQHFPRSTLQRNIRQPLETVGYEAKMDVVARIHGGGISAQAGALRHGVSRALIEADPNLRGELKRRGFLTRDSRVKERKKAGLKKARKRPQFSKR